MRTCANKPQPQALENKASRDRSVREHRRAIHASGKLWRKGNLWSHVDDIARAHILAMEKGKPGQCYIIAGPEQTLVGALDMAEKITGVPAPKRRVSPGVMKAMAALMGVVEKVAAVPEAYTAESLRVIAGVTYLGDNARARRELGYSPRPLKEGLAETLRHEMKSLGMA